MIVNSSVFFSQFQVNSKSQPSRLLVRDGIKMCTSGYLTKYIVALESERIKVPSMNAGLSRQLPSYETNITIANDGELLQKISVFQ